MVGFVMDYTIGGRISPEFEIDPNYEFSAPHYFDFIQGETIEEANEAERWFKTACTYPASPFGPKIKARKSFAVSALCGFKEATRVEQVDAPPSPGFIKDNGQIVTSSADEFSQMQTGTINCDGPNDNGSGVIHQEKETCTPRTQIIPKVTQQIAINGTSLSNRASVTKTGVSKSDKQCVPGSTVIKSTKQAIARCIQNIALKKDKSVERSAVNEHQAVKRQKLEAGRLRQILNIKERILPHKVQSNMTLPKDLTATMDKNKERQWKSASKIATLASPFVSMAEKVKRFQSKTPERFHNQPISQDGSVGFLSQKPKLMLTRPKEPELETAQRARPIRVKSTAELEEEMLAKIPKFKARPLNKKILEAPSLPVLQKSVPQLPEFQEFHLKTMERAMQHCVMSSIASSSVDSAGVPDKQRCEPAPGGVLTEPKPPHLETALRARPPKVMKSSEELELEELEKMPKFKARPLNKRIFISRGDLGVFCNLKRQVTTPMEFHFATDERPHPPPLPPTELFKKLSLNSEPHHDPVPQPTKPHPFHLLTEDRGAEKERKFMSQLLEHEQKEQQARIPKANPYPYTTDYPVIPPKPHPKECTRPEPFQLESLIRHEEELQRMMEEQARIEREEAEMRNFRAQPMITNSVPMHVPERPRKPLTEVQEFTFHADARAVERAEFEKKVKEKENLYKRFREEYETARMMEEERAVKMMRKMMVPHARPLPAFNNPFVPQRSTKELTKPKSPKLRVLNRKERRRSSISSAQKKFQMR